MSDTRALNRRPPDRVISLRLGAHNSDFCFHCPHTTPFRGGYMDRLSREGRTTLVVFDHCPADSENIPSSPVQ